MVLLIFCDVWHCPCCYYHYEISNIIDESVPSFLTNALASECVLVSVVSNASLNTSLPTVGFIKEMGSLSLEVIHIWAILRRGFKIGNFSDSKETASFSNVISSRKLQILCMQGCGYIKANLTLTLCYFFFSQLAVLSKSQTLDYIRLVPQTPTPSHHMCSKFSHCQLSFGSYTIVCYPNYNQ